MRVVRVVETEERSLEAVSGALRQRTGRNAEVRGSRSMLKTARKKDEISTPDSHSMQYYAHT